MKALFDEDAERYGERLGEGLQRVSGAGLATTFDLRQKGLSDPDLPGKLDLGQSAMLSQHSNRIPAPVDGFPDLKRESDIITAGTGEITRTIKVLGLVEHRVGAKLLGQFLEDLTPASEYSKSREKVFRQFVFRPKGSGRPTKKDRRSLGRFLG